MMSCGTAGSLVQEVLGEAEQDLWHPGKLQPWTYRSTLSVSQCCIVLSPSRGSLSPHGEVHSPEQPSMSLQSCSLPKCCFLLVLLGPGFVG